MTSSQRADIVTRRNDATSFDAGIHARAEVGVFDIGLAVASSEYAIVIRAPTLGTLHLVIDRRDLEKTVLSRAVLMSPTGEEIILQAGFASSMSELGLVRSALGEIQHSLTTVQAERDSLTKQLGEARNDLDLLAASHQTQRVELEARVAQLEAEIGQQYQSFSEGNSQLQQALQAATAERDSAMASTADAQKALEGHRALVTDLQKSVESKSFEALELQKHAATVETLRAKLEASESARREITSELKSANAMANELTHSADDVAAMRREHQHLQEQLSQAADRRQALETQISAQSSELNALKKRAADLEQQLESPRTDSTDISSADPRADLTAALADLDATKAAAATEMKAMSDQVKAAMDAQAALDAQLKAEKRATRDALDQVRVLKSSTKKLETEREEARTFARQLHAQIVMGAGVEGLKKEVHELREVLDAERSLSAKLVSEREREEMRAEALQRDLDSEKAAHARANDERDLYRDRFRALTTSRDTGAHRRPDATRVETRSYRAKDAPETHIDVPAIELPDEPATDPMARAGLLKKPK